jgi:cupin fold WbuC family metalloprotein
MIKFIGDINNPYAIVIPNDYDFEVGKIKFLTNIDSSQQIGIMHRASGYKIKPHKHNFIQRVISITQEVLIIKKGKCKISIFDDNDSFISEIVVSAGDIIFLAMGGHGIEVIEDVSIIEIKQGPYLKENDKKYLKFDSDV